VKLEEQLVDVRLGLVDSGLEPVREVLEHEAPLSRPHRERLRAVAAAVQRGLAEELRVDAQTILLGHDAGGDKPWQRSPDVLRGQLARPRNVVDRAGTQHYRRHDTQPFVVAEEPTQSRRFHGEHDSAGSRRSFSFCS
jgi:hypothetical protein